MKRFRQGTRSSIYAADFGAKGVTAFGTIYRQAPSFLSFLGGLEDEIEAATNEGKGASRAMRQGRPLPTLPDPKPDIHRNNDLLFYRVGGMPKMAKASLSRLLHHFDNKKDFVILTSYQSGKTEQENIDAFEGFPRQYRSLFGSMEVKAFELVGHWQEQDQPELLKRFWFIVTGDPQRSSEDFVVAGKALAEHYQQTALIISRQGVSTLESPKGEVIGDLTAAGAIENALHTMMQRRGAFEEKCPGSGYSESLQLKDDGRASKFVLNNLPQGTADEVPEKTASVPFCIYVGMAANNMERWVWSIWGQNSPNWRIRENPPPQGDYSAI